MKEIKIILTEEELKKVQEVLNYNGSLDLSEETFDGSSIILDMGIFGAMISVKGYKEEYIGIVHVDIPKD